MLDAGGADDLNGRIAARVRGLRAGLGLSLDALAGKCDVSRSMLSLVERGEASATAVVLEKIATGLGVSLASLFERPLEAASPVSRGAERTVWRDPQSGYQRRNISPTFPSPIQLVEATMPAGASVAFETGARNAAIHQQIWVQEGAIEVTVGAETHHLQADDCLAMRLDAPVSFRNRTKKAVRYIVALVSGGLR